MTRAMSGWALSAAVQTERILPKRERRSTKFSSAKVPALVAELERTACGAESAGEQAERLIAWSFQGRRVRNSAMKHKMTSLRTLLPEGLITTSSSIA